MRTYKLAKLLLYGVALGYPWYELRIEGVQVVSYEGIGSIAFPLAVLIFQLPRVAPGPSLKRVLSELLAAAVLATLAQFVYLGIQGYLHQPEDMRRMIQFDWIALPLVLLVLWFLNRTSGGRRDSMKR